MKIATFNVNNINKLVQNLLGWLTSSKPDVVCLQELKCTQSEFLAEVLRKIGYEAVWCGERSWNGVAILARDHTPVLTRSSLPGDPEDTQAASSRLLLTGYCSPRSISQMAILSPARSLLTNWSGSIGSSHTQPNFWALE